jgi:NAD-dependent dihydropyrimidine dehydrogenase PreA subunit
MGNSDRLGYRMIQVGRFTVGLLGLDQVFASLREDGFAPNETVIPELLSRARRHNYIASASEDQYAKALLREFEVFCRQQANCSCATDYGTWHGHPRESIPWYPTIRAALCDGCGACLRFCSFGVFAQIDDDTVEVVEPFRCQVGCSACVPTCQVDAISFPSKQILEMLR